MEGAQPIFSCDKINFGRSVGAILLSKSCLKERSSFWSTSVFECFKAPFKPKLLCSSLWLLPLSQSLSFGLQSHLRPSFLSNLKVWACGTCAKCAVKTSPCLCVRANMHRNEVPGLIQPNLDVFQSCESLRSRSGGSCEGEPQSVLTSVFYNTPPFMISACSCQQPHLPLFCQAEQIPKSAGCR